MKSRTRGPDLGTVRNYLSSAAELGAANRHEAVQLARSRGGSDRPRGWPAVGHAGPARGERGEHAPRGGPSALGYDDISGRLSAPAAQVDAGLGGAELVELTC